MDPALSITSRGPISEPSEVVAEPIGQCSWTGGSLSLRPLSLTRSPRNISHGTLPQDRENSCAWHGHGAVGNKSPQGESGFLPGQATLEFQPLFSFSLLYSSTQETIYSGVNPQASRMVARCF